MSFKRDLAETLVACANKVAPNSQQPLEPKSILVLRNNDIGDLLVITPLFQALRRLFPHTHLVAGVGSWNVATLAGNPYISEVLPVNAPWHNQAIKDQSLYQCLSYIVFSDESEEIQARRFDIGIDIVGSHFGSLLMLKAGIPYRMGVKGFAGGHTGVQKYVEYNHHEHVGRSALRFAELLGAKSLPPVRPQLFLSKAERAEAEKHWTKPTKRIVIGPGGGFAGKCWPIENYIALLSELNDDVALVIVGGQKEIPIGQMLKAANAKAIDLTGQLSLRQSFAMVATSNLVISNSSMLMHAAAAFEIPHVITLGKYFTSKDQHMSQWGYPGLTTIPGVDGSICSVNEVLDVSKKIIHDSH